MLAVDPSSPFSGGALLGDRVRMADHAEDPGVFIRSMATRGPARRARGRHAAGAARARAAGCDVVLIETVGVGQSEVDVVALADTTVVLLAPGMGDGVQAAKAGVLEVADVFVVNKADRDGADPGGARAAAHDRARRGAASGGCRSCARWRPAARAWTSWWRRSTRTGAWSDGSGERERRRVARAEAEIEAVAVTRLRARIRDAHGGPGCPTWPNAWSAGELDAYAAADELQPGLVEPRVEIRRRPGIVGGAG